MGMPERKGRQVPVKNEKGETTDIAVNVASAVEKQLDPKDPSKGVTFFSRFSSDEILFSCSETQQVGTNKWVTVPPEIIHFHNHVHVTNDTTHIEYLRGHNRFGIELFEFGKDAQHDKGIKRYDDSGIIKKLDKLHKIGKILERQHAQGIPGG